MEYMTYLGETEYNLLERLMPLIDRKGYVPCRKIIASELHMSAGAVNLMFKRLIRAHIMVRVSPGLWCVLVSPEDFKDNLKKEMMKDDN
jgi:hypothetical protein